MSTGLASIRKKFASYSKVTCFALAALVAVTVVFLPADLSPEDRKALTVVSFMLILFITGAVPLAVAGLMGCFGFWVVCGLPFSQAFAGFTQSTPWFILGALMMGATAVKARLPQRFAYFLMSKMRPSYSLILAAMVVLDFLLTFILPSGTARVVILLSLAVGLIQGFGYDLKSNIGRGMILILTFSATIFDKTILAGAASILARGIIETQTGYSIGWGEWFFAYAPVDLLLITACWFLTLKLFPPEVKRFENFSKSSFIEDKRRELGPFTLHDAKGLVLILAATLLWITDVFHGIAPEIVGIGFGLLAFVPKIGILSKSDFESLNFSVVIFVGAALSMSSIMISTDFLTNIGTFLFSWIAPLIQSDQLLSLALYFMANIFHLFLGNEPSMLAASMPSVMDFATNHGLNPAAIGMIWVFAAGGKLFVYQSAILAIGYSYGAFTLRDLFKMGLALILVEAILISLVVPLYWPLMNIPLHV